MSASILISIALQYLLVPELFMHCFVVLVSFGVPAENADISNLVDGAAALETYLAKVKDLLDLLQGGLSTLCPQIGRASCRERVCQYV